MTAAATVTIYSSADLCGRLFTSFLGDRLFKKRVMYLNIACCLLLGLENFAAGFATLYYQLVIFCVVAGFTAGAMTAVLFTSSSEVLDGWFTQELFAVSRVGSGLGIIVGIGMTGVIYDLSGSYHYVFHINLGVFAFAALCFGAVVLIRNCILRKQPNEDSEELPLTRPVQ
ncbi:uncharacterized protein LOC106155446 [Lingula anatina]|uniref:Uncharacterized protein LOC106155446 n=1 Tax=Lingula anatina TaxID=7574 RepID=A0A1S3HI28_LINAN|nr:uncharacterized protein LOC106155446 [Lingula anatina]|eukprot:XP_013385763.1 uncharacterized protein LOC106155446 [Lingula anatina]